MIEPSFEVLSSISTIALELREEKYISDQVDILNRWLDEID